MAVETSGNLAKALWPGVKTWYGMAYNEHAVEYTQIFQVETSDKAWEEEQGVVGYGLAVIKPEGEGISYDQAYQGFTKRYQHIVYGLGFVITKEAIEDNQYKELAKRRSRALAFSMRQTKETVCANVLNRGFNSSYVGADGVELFSSVHPNVTGGTWANELTTPADLSEASLEQACIDINRLQNDRGLQIAIMQRKLIIPPALEFQAGRILQSTLQNNSANNAINVLKATGKFPDGVCINHYLTDQDAWFIKTNCPDGLKYFKRRADRFGVDQDFDTENAKYKATARYSVGWTDPRGAFASEGA